MMSNKKGMLWLIPIILGFITLLILALFVFGETISIPAGSDSPSKVKVVCDVELQNPLLKSVNIKTLSCHSEGGCLWSLSVQSLAIFSDDGTVEMRLGTSVEKKTYSIREADSKSFRLSSCTAEREGYIYLLDSDGNVLETKKFGVN